MPPWLLEPLAEVPISPSVAALPKADLHLHADADGRLDRVVARRAGRPAHDWRTWATHLHQDIPPGMPRLEHWRATHCLAPEVEALDADPDTYLARIMDVIEEAANDGVILVEVRFGATTILRPDFLAVFREAERRVQAQHPRCRAEAIISGLTPSQPARWQRVLPVCLEAARHGLAGIDIIPDPYDAEADWSGVDRWTERAAAAGLGITVHAGEFSTANVAAAIQLPGVKRLGHAVFAARDPRLLDAVARSGVTVECCLSCNVLLGGVATYQEHPLRQFMAAGIPVTLNTDDPVRVCTTIRREYAIAAALGCSPAELLSFTRNAVQASFTSAERRTALLEDLERINPGVE